MIHDMNNSVVWNGQQLQTTFNEGKCRFTLSFLVYFRWEPKHMNIIEKLNIHENECWRSRCAKSIHTHHHSLSMFVSPSLTVFSVSPSFTVGCMYALCMLANENGNDDRDADMHDFVQEFSSQTKYVGVLQSANQQCDYVKVLFRCAKNVCVSRRSNRASLWTFSFYAICKKNLKKKTFPIFSLSLSSLDLLQ